jgi:superfamily II DNA or RNA helicase
MQLNSPRPSSGNVSQHIVAAREHVDQLEKELAQARAILKALESQGSASEDLRISTDYPSPPHLSSTFIINAESSLSDKLTLFHQRFSGRQDAYAVRWVSRKTLKAGWSPAVRGGFYTDKKTDADLLSLTPEILERHLRGSDEGVTEFHVGLYPMTTNNRCKLLACDFDGESWKADAAAFSQACEEAGIRSLAEISRSGNGAHVWIFFESWMSASTARQAGTVLLRKAMQKTANIKLNSYDRFFPAQDELPVHAPGRFRLGNLIALPLQGNCRRRGTTVFADPDTWKPYNDQFEALAQATPVPETTIKELAVENKQLAIGPVHSVPLSRRPERKELQTGLAGKIINIRRSSMLRVKTDDLPPAFITELKHRASIANPEFYRRQAQRFSTFGVPRLVTCFEHADDELRLPRGLADETRRLLKKAGARVSIRNIGKRPAHQEVSFTGELRPDQRHAVDALLQHQDGVLVAPPGSGKTVVACALVAERQVPTAILVNRAELIHQWRERLASFLDISDHQIGQLGNGRKKRKGFIDLIMMQSISRRGADPTILNEYGQIIIDECHAVAAPAAEAAVREVNVKYWTGLTATPFRADQMDELITMQCGPIRHVIETPVQECRQLIVHETTFETDEPGTDGPSVQAIYNELSLDPHRNRLIADQIEQAAAEQRYCMVLTNRITHLQALHELLKDRVSNPVFVLHGQLTAQQRNQVRESIAKAAARNEPFILLSIDKIAGEGLDIPVMDTLFLTMPVSFKGRVIQQAGRVTRGSAPGQKTAIVHDFHDAQVPLLARMHRRRSKVLQKEGFALEPQLPFVTR